MYVTIEAPDGSWLEGVVVDGAAEGTGFNLDQPFTIETDDGERLRVVSPWACSIEVGL